MIQKWNGVLLETKRKESPNLFDFLPKQGDNWEKNKFVGRFFMRTFDYSKLADQTWYNEILSYVAKIHEFKGKQELYIRKKLVELERLVEVAKIQSTEASNQIEGIVTTKSRVKSNKFKEWIFMTFWHDELRQIHKIPAVFLIY